MEEAFGKFFKPGCGNGSQTSVRMKYEDHVDTASWGKSNDAARFRKAQAELVGKEKWSEAFDMGVDDLKQFGDVYDAGIELAKEHFLKWIKRCGGGPGAPTPA
jgi:hypothetical protein